MRWLRASIGLQTKQQSAGGDSMLGRLRQKANEWHAPLIADLLEPVDDWWRRQSPGSRQLAPLIALNIGVYALWRGAMVSASPWPLRWMTRHFADHGGTKKGSLHTMLTATVSHATLWHLGANMWALWSFGPALLASPLFAGDRDGNSGGGGLYHFGAFYIAGGLAASLASRWARGLNLMAAGPSLGASGALFAVVAAMSAVWPDMRVRLLFVPGVDWSIEHLLYGLMAIDAVCLLSGRFAVFDHAVSQYSTLDFKAILTCTQLGPPGRRTVWPDVRAHGRRTVDVGDGAATRLPRLGAATAARRQVVAAGRLTSRSIERFISRRFLLLCRSDLHGHPNARLGTLLHTHRQQQKII